MLILCNNEKVWWYNKMKWYVVLQLFKFRVVISRKCQNSMNADYHKEILSSTFDHESSWASSSIAEWVSHNLFLTPLNPRHRFQSSHAAQLVWHLDISETKRDRLERWLEKNDQPKVKKCIFVTGTRNKKKKLHEAVTYPLAKCSYTTSPACVQPDALLFQWCKDSSVDLRLMKRQDVGVKVDA